MMRRGKQVGHGWKQWWDLRNVIFVVQEIFSLSQHFQLVLGIVVGLGLLCLVFAGFA